MNNDLRKIVLFLIFLFFFIRYFVVPFIRIIVNIVKLVTIKKKVASFGKEIVKIPESKKNKKGLAVYNIAVFLLIFIFGALNKEPAVFLLLLFILPPLLDILVMNAFSKYNGIYENGIVTVGFLEWNEIFSWKIIDDNKISILKQDGLRFDLETGLNTKSVVEYFVQKGISKEK